MDSDGQEAKSVDASEAKIYIFNNGMRPASNGIGVSHMTNAGSEEFS